MDRGLGLGSNQRNTILAMISNGLEEPYILRNTIRNRLVADSLESKGICTIVSSKTKISLYPQKEHSVFEVLGR